MTFLRISLRAFLLVACLGAFVSGANAQFRASIQGVVTDPQGAVVTGATVSLKNLETGIVQTSTTNENGIYNFNALPPSKYSITVEASGFKKKQIDGVGVIADQANGLNISLDIGQSSETVTVSGDATPNIDTETANLSGTVKASQIQKLPSFGRDPFQLLQLAPGAFGDGSQGAGGGTNNLPSTTIGGTGGTDGVFKIENGGQITAGGARTGDNNYQIDGVGTTSVTWGGTSVITPNEDSIKEIKIVTDNYDAENGRYRGAQVQVISQNGTNDYHGSLYIKLHRPGLNAFTKYNGYNNGNVRDDSRFNDFGGSVGGPIWKNKIFAFFSYERLSNNAQQGVGGAWYETPQFRALAAGPNASAFLNFPGVAPNGGNLVDKTCADAGLVQGVNCNFIAGQGLNLGSPLTAGVGVRDAAYTDKDHPGTGGDGLGGANNLNDTPDVAFYQGTVEPNNDSHVQYNGRIDVNATSKDLVAFSIYYVPNSSTFFNGNGDRPMNLFNSTYLNRAQTAIWDHTFNPTLVNEARVNAAGWQQKDLGDNPNGPFGLPQISFNAAGSITPTGYGIGSFNGFDQWTYAAKDVLTKIQGAHTLKFGAEYTKLLSVDAPFWSDRPGYTFNNIWDFLNDAPISENAQFDPASGIPSALRKDLRSDVIGLFVQDNYKVRSNLTVTLGLRWEYFGAISEKNGKLATVVLGNGPNTFTDLRVRTGGNLYTPDSNNFGPQVGFAWSPNHFFGRDFGNRFALRGGFGVAFNGISQSNSLDGRFNPPFTYNSTTLTGSDILYSDSFPADVHDPNGYASNPAGIVTFGPDNLPLTGRTDLTAFPNQWPTTYTYHYTLGGEYEFMKDWVASVGYQGSVTRHLTQHYNLYDAGAANGFALNPAVSGITYYADDGSAGYNALLLELKHNFSRTFELDTQYRFSHTTDSGSNAYAGGLYQFDMATNYGTSDYDVRHAFKVYGIWSPTIFRGAHSWAEKILGGWSVSGILNAHTGFPFTPFYNVGAITGGVDPVFSFGPNAGGSSSDAGSGNILPGTYLGGFKPDFRSNVEVVGGGGAFFTAPNVVGGTLFECLFVTGPTANCPTGQEGFGPVPSFPGVARNTFRGPGYFDVDATLSKTFGLPEMKVLGSHAGLELRANFYNLFNKLNLTNIQSDITDPHFGQAQNALGSRTIEVQARFSF